MSARPPDPTITPDCSWEELPQLLRVSEVARLLRTTTDSVYSWIHHGGLPSLRGLQMLRVPRDELKAWLERER